MDTHAVDQELGPGPTFGALLRRYRLAAGLTQEALAERARLSVRAITALERGVNRSPRRETLQLLVEALALPERLRAQFEGAAHGYPGNGLSMPVGSAIGHDAPLPTTLVGRACEVAALQRHLAGDGPPVLLFAGEPGIGKTRLLREVARVGATEGLTVLQGGCDRRTGQDSYAPLLQALESHIRWRSPREIGRALQGCSWLARLLPELRGVVEAPLPLGVLPVEQERRVVFNAVRRFLWNLAGPAGVLLVVDDLQWAGSDALDLLATLVQSASDMPLRVVGAYRDTEVGGQHALSSLLADLARDDLLTHLPLPPLSTVEASQLLQELLAETEAVDPLVQEQILQRAEGVPFFLISCARGLRVGVLATGTEHELPWDLVQIVRHRIGNLPDTTQEVLSVAGVAGRAISPSLLAGVLGISEDTVLLALDLACRAGVVDEEGPGYSFAHDVIREVIETNLGRARRTLLHRRIAQELERLQESARSKRAGEMAWHYREGDLPESALTYALIAGDQAEAVFAYADAEKHYRSALELAGHPAVSPERQHAAETEALEKLGVALSKMTRLDEALQTLEQAARMYRAQGDLEDEGRVVAHIGRVHFLRGTEEEGIARLGPVVDGLAQIGPSPALARLYVAQAGLMDGLCRNREQLAAADKGIAVARAIGDNEVLATAGQMRGRALLSLRRLDEALQTYEGILPQLEEARNIASLNRALVDTAFVYDARGELREERAHLERALELAREIEDPLRVNYALEALAWNLLVVGRWTEVRSRIEEMESVLRPLGRSRRSGYSLFLRAELALRQGRTEEARRYLEEALSLHGHVHNIEETVQFFRARLDLLAGCPEAALPVLRCQVEEREPNPNLTLLPYLAEAYLGVGEVARTENLVTRATEWARAAQDRRTLVEALRVRGLLMMRRARWLEARDALEEALSLTRSIGIPWEEGRVLFLLGEVHASAGEPQHAQERLVEGQTIFKRLEAEQ